MLLEVLEPSSGISRLSKEQPRHLGDAVGGGLRGAPPGSRGMPSRLGMPRSIAIAGAAQMYRLGPGLRVRQMDGIVIDVTPRQLESFGGGFASEYARHRREGREPGFEKHGCWSAYVLP